MNPTPSRRQPRPDALHGGGVRPLPAPQRQLLVVPRGRGGAVLLRDLDGLRRHHHLRVVQLDAVQPLPPVTGEPPPSGRGGSAICTLRHEKHVYAHDSHLIHTHTNHRQRNHKHTSSHHTTPHHAQHMHMRTHHKQITGTQKETQSHTRARQDGFRGSILGHKHKAHSQLDWLAGRQGEGVLARKAGRPGCWSTAPRRTGPAGRGAPAGRSTPAAAPPSGAAPPRPPQQGCVPGDPREGIGTLVGGGGHGEQGVT